MILYSGNPILNPIEPDGVSGHEPTGALPLFFDKFMKANQS